MWTCSDLAEKYNNEAESPRSSDQQTATMEYTSQMWLWEDLFPPEKDAFPGVYPKRNYQQDLGLRGEAAREVQGKLRARLRCLEVDDNQPNEKVLVFFCRAL
jgi:hypothetical protein